MVDGICGNRRQVGEPAHRRADPDSVDQHEHLTGRGSPIVAVFWAPSGPKSDIVTPAVDSMASATVFAPRASMSAAETTVTLLGTSLVGCSTRVAVTVTSSRVLSASCAMAGPAAEQEKNRDATGFHVRDLDRRNRLFLRGP